MILSGPVTTSVAGAALRHQTDIRAVVTGPSSPSPARDGAPRAFREIAHLLVCVLLDGRRDERAWLDHRAGRRILRYNDPVAINHRNSCRPEGIHSGGYVEASPAPSILCRLVVKTNPVRDRDLGIHGWCGGTRRRGYGARRRRWRSVRGSLTESLGDRDGRRRPRGRVRIRGRCATAGDDSHANRETNQTRARTMCT